MPFRMEEEALDAPDDADRNPTQTNASYSASGRERWTS